MVYTYVLEIKFTNQGVEKRDGLAPRLDQCERQGRIDYAQRYPGNAGPRANVHDSLRLCRHERFEQKGIEEKPSADRCSCAERGEVVGPVPVDQEIGIAIEGLPLDRGCRPAEECREGLE